MLLSPYRALDLTRLEGLLRAQVPGDLGADVIQVEPNVQNSPELIHDQARTAGKTVR